MTAILFDPDARREFLEAVRFYEDRRLGLGLNFRQLIEAGLQQISEQVSCHPGSIPPLCVVKIPILNYLHH